MIPLWKGQGSLCPKGACDDEKNERLVGGALVLCLRLGRNMSGGRPPVKTAEKRDTLIYVRTKPPGAKVFVDGKELGTTNGLFHVEAGVATIVLELEGHGQVTRTQ